MEENLSHITVNLTPEQKEVISLDLDKQIGLERDGNLVFCVCVSVMSESDYHTYNTQTHVF